MWVADQDNNHLLAGTQLAAVDILAVGIQVEGILEEGIQAVRGNPAAVQIQAVLLDIRIQELMAGHTRRNWEVVDNRPLEKAFKGRIIRVCYPSSNPKVEGPIYFRSDVFKSLL